MCGYSSQTSFIRAFKERFHQTPKAWRNGGNEEYSANILKNSTMLLYEKKGLENIEPKIVKSKALKTYYIRQRGYLKEDVIKIWQKLQAWVYTNNITKYDEIGIYHDNPTITPHNECFYVAGIIPRGEVDLSNTSLPIFYTPEALYATFEIKGKMGDILRFIQWAYQEWLPNSGFETTTNPPYVIFKKNHFLNEDRLFEATYYLPIQYV
jgi:AraC family transcriptional regulator